MILYISNKVEFSWSSRSNSSNSGKRKIWFRFLLGAILYLFALYKYRSFALWWFLLVVWHTVFFSSLSLHLLLLISFLFIFIFFLLLHQRRISVEFSSCTVHFALHLQYLEHLLANFTSERKLIRIQIAAAHAKQSMLWNQPLQYTNMTACTYRMQFSTHTHTHTHSTSLSFVSVCTMSVFLAVNLWFRVFEQSLKSWKMSLSCGIFVLAFLFLTDANGKAYVWIYVAVCTQLWLTCYFVWCYKMEMISLNERTTVFSAKHERTTDSFFYYCISSSQSVFACEQYWNQHLIHKNQFI